MEELFLMAEILQELKTVFAKFGEESIIDLDLWNLQPEVFEFYKQTQGKEIKYLSEYLMLIEGNLGVITSCVKQLLKELDRKLRLFRKFY